MQRRIFVPPALREGALDIGRAAWWRARTTLGGAVVPELPDIELYLAALRPRVVGRVIERTRVASPFFVRSYDPPIWRGRRARRARVSSAWASGCSGRSTMTCSSSST